MDNIELVSLLFNFTTNAFCVAMLNGLLISDVLFTFPNPTLLAFIPFAILLSVMAPSINFEVTIALFAMVGISAVPLRSPASFIFPFVVASASTMEALFTLITPKLEIEAST